MGGHQYPPGSVSHFCVHGSEARDHIPDEKWTELQHTSENCICFCYFKYVKGYRIIKSHSNDIIIRIYVKFYENISDHEPNSTSIPSMANKPYSPLMLPSTPNFLDIVPNTTSYFEDDYNEDENALPPPHFASIAPIESLT